MRIIGGKCGGRKIRPVKNLRARPTTDFAKESLFNILFNLVDFESIDVLDLFSGTGSISYEFASRGALSVTAVESFDTHHKFIQDNARLFELDNLYAIKADVFKFLKSSRQKFDVIFVDPPYDLPNYDEVVELILSGDKLKSGGVLVVEHGKERSFRKHPSFTQSRSYGGVVFSFFGVDKSDGE